jgi:hypothetical protein
VILRQCTAGGWKTRNVSTRSSEKIGKNERFNIDVLAGAGREIGESQTDQEWIEKLSRQSFRSVPTVFMVDHFCETCPGRQQRRHRGMTGCESDLDLV